MAGIWCSNRSITGMCDMPRVLFMRLINALFPVSAWHLLCNGEVYLLHQAPWVLNAYL